VKWLSAPLAWSWPPRRTQPLGKPEGIESQFADDRAMVQGAHHWVREGTLCCAAVSATAEIEVSAVLLRPVLSMSRLPTPARWSLRCVAAARATHPGPQNMCIFLTSRCSLAFLSVRATLRCAGGPLTLAPTRRRRRPSV
jgi:hypothetical protein